MVGPSQNFEFKHLFLSSIHLYHATLFFNTSWSTQEYNFDNVNIEELVLGYQTELDSEFHTKQAYFNDHL